MIKFIKRNLKRIVCGALCLTLVAPTTFAKTIAELESEQDAIQGEKAIIQGILDELSNDEANAVAYQETLEREIELTQESIDNANASIKALNESILELTANIDAAATEYKDTLALLQERIKVIYTSGSVSTLEILLNSTSLYDFSLRTTTLEAVAEHDQELMAEIQEYADLTKSDREALAEQKEKVAELKKQLEVDAEELTVLVEENNTVIAEIQSKKGTQQALYNDLDSEDDEYNKLIAELLAQQQEQNKPAPDTNTGTNTDDKDDDDDKDENTGSLSSGFDPLWPLPGFMGSPWETCDFGNGHYGFDIAAYYGTPIVASASGYVTSAQYHYSWGNNVLLYHNGTFSTRYAHMSSMAVSAGDYVSAGQVIGYIGSTGNSTGNHLHYEVYKNGTRVDPEPYLKGW